MRIRGIVCALCLFAWPALAAAQGYVEGVYAEGSGERSVIRPAGYGWRNYVEVPDGPCGHAMPVRADCYDVCRPCGLRPLCFLKRVARTLDCLLPCNLCHGHGYRTGPLHGCILGGRWGCGGCCAGGCCANPAGSCFDDIGCAGGPSCAVGPSCGCESCSSAVPMLSDPFQDDPLPPRPQPAREVRRTPTSMPTRSVLATPQRTAAHSAPRQATMPQQTAQAAPRPMTMPQRTTVQAAPRPTTMPRPAAPPRASSPYKITTAAHDSGSARVASPQSVLRQTAHERELLEPAPHWIDHKQAQPIIRSQSPPETPDDLEIPYNPLRGR